MNLSLMDAELERDEGRRYVPYTDNSKAKNLTVGIGHNLDASPIPPAWVYPLTDDEIDQLLDHDLSITIAALDLHIGWWRTLDEVRQRCVCNVAFNIGVGGLMGFHEALPELKAGNYANAAQDFQDSDWYREVGIRAKRVCWGILKGVMPTDTDMADMT